MVSPIRAWSRRVTLAWGRAAVYLLPARCFVCGAELPSVQYLGGCGACWTRLVPACMPSCVSCGVPLAEQAGPLGPSLGRCARCVLRPLPLDGVTAAFLYDQTARRFLLRAKAGRRRELLRPFGRQLAAAVRSRGISGDLDAVVPVPTAPLARLRRGFDPALLIGREVARILDLPLERGRLKRRLASFREAKGLSAVERWRAAGHAFVPSGSGSGRVLLVDDVMTSGATASACAIALRDSGASSVRLAVWARTPSHGRF